MNEIGQQSWKECLALWKELSNTPDREFDYPLMHSTFKNETLKKLGIEYKANGCPFCERYINTPDCPLGMCNEDNTSCIDTPYGIWSNTVTHKEKHSQKLAKDFYEYLLKVAEERGYKER